MAGIVLPIFIARIFLLVTCTKLGEIQDLELFFCTAVVTHVVCVAIPYLWCLSKPGFPKKFVRCYETTLFVDRKMEGEPRK